MNEQDARASVYAAIGQIAPDADPSQAGEDARLRQDLELDSLDFLALVETIARTTGVEIPESDYPRIATVKSLIAYLAERG